jgi:hypothetical protein
MLVLGTSASQNTKSFLGGDFESIATTTVGAGGVATITFSSIPSTYSHLQVRILSRSTYAALNTSVIIRANSDTASNYSYHSLSGDGATASSYGVGTDIFGISQMYPGSSAAASIFGVGVIDILDYANTNKYKTIRSLGGQDRNGSGSVNFMSSNWRSNSAISTLTFTTDGNFAQYTSFALYGIK